MIMGQPFGMVMTGIGIIANAGVIVNNNIVLIDTYDRLRQRRRRCRGGDPRDLPRARAAGGADRRWRAILGVLPIAFGLNIEFVHARDHHRRARARSGGSSLSTAIVFGLGFATILTLVVTPAALMSLAKSSAWRERRRERRPERRAAKLAAAQPAE